MKYSLKYCLNNHLRNALMIQRILIIKVFILAMIYSNISFGKEVLTDDMKQFIQLAASKNGDQNGFDREEAAKVLGVTFEKSGRNYYSTKHLRDLPDQAVFEYSVNDGRRYLTFYFDEPIKSFNDAINHLYGFKGFLIDRKQINGLPIYYFEGKSPSEFIKTRKLWIRIYECSDKPKEKCVRKAQLIFGQSI